MIAIEYQGKIYKIAKEPHENIEDTYKRGWFIIKNLKDNDNYEEIVNKSIIYLNENKNNMKYS